MDERMRTGKNRKRDIDYINKEKERWTMLIDRDHYERNNSG